MVIVEFHRINESIIHLILHLFAEKTMEKDKRKHNSSLMFYFVFISKNGKNWTQLSHIVSCTRVGAQWQLLYNFKIWSFFFSFPTFSQHPNSTFIQGFYPNIQHKETLRSTKKMVKQKQSQ